MALRRTPVDVYPAGLDQRPADHQGPQGRIKQLINGQATRYDRGNGQPPRFLLETRDGFRRLTNAARGTDGASLGTITRDEANLLTAVNDQLIDVSDRVPRVFSDPATNDQSFVEYSDERVVTNRLTEETLTGGYGISQVPSTAILNGVQAVCWTEAGGGQFPRLMIGFKQVDGPWLVPPYRLSGPDPTFAASANPTIVGHMLTDGTNFWCVYDVESAHLESVDCRIWFAAFDIHGVLLGIAATVRSGQTLPMPGYWDVVRAKDTPTSLLLAQVAAPVTDPSQNQHVKFTRASWNGSAVVLTENTDATIACNGPVAWYTNDRGDGFDYLLTRGPGGDFGVMHTYRIVALAASVTYKTFSLTAAFDAMTGYYPAPDATEQSLFAVVGLAEPVQTSGPQWNPQLRTIQTWQISNNPAGVDPALVRTSHQQALVSRSFALGTAEKADYLNVTFYQSGQGYADATPITLTPGLGDYFIGSPTQKLVVNPGDHVRGSPLTIVSANAVIVTPSIGSAGIVSGDKVEAIPAPAGIVGVPAGTPVLRWTIAGLTRPGQPTRGGRLHVAGSTISSANASWPIVGDDGAGSHVFYTTTTNTAGGTVAPGTFGTAGNADVVSMTAYVIPGLEDIVPVGTEAYFNGGQLVVTGNPSPSNNGTFTIAGINQGNSYPPGPDIGLPQVMVVTGTQLFSTSGFTATVSPFGQNTWFLTSNEVSGAMIGDSLVVSGDDNAGNNGSFEITFVFDPGEFQTDDATAIVTEVFKVGHVPTISLELGPDHVAYTFHLGGIAAALATNPQRFIGATLSFTSADHTGNTGDYVIVGFDPALDGTVYTQRIVADEQQVTESLDGSDSVVIFLASAPGAQPFQPSFFLTPSEGTRPFVGQFDRLLAYNDWRRLGANQMCGHLASLTVDAAGGIRVALPSRQEVVPELVATSNQVIQASTVGVKSWTLAAASGTPVGNLLPGAAAISFEDDAWPEDGFALAPEAPWFANQGVAPTGQLALTPKQAYTYSFQWESQDQRGNRVFSPPSPALTVRLTGDNNQMVLGGVTPKYWLTTPTDQAGHTSITNRNPVAACVYRTAISNGVTTVARYKLTSDLNPNGVSPVAADTVTGFIFGGDRFLYVDQNADQVILENEPQYTALPRFGAPCSTAGCEWLDRRWLIAADGSIWFSTSLTDGVRQSYFPGFRIAPPTGDRPVALAGMDRYLIVIGQRYNYWLPAVQLPDANGRGGTIPSLVRLPFNNGGLGLALACPAGVLYDSTAGGVWLITRDLENRFFSEALTGVTAGTVAGLVIDGKQRLALSTTGGLYVFDFVSQLWSRWDLQAAARAVTLWRGQLAVRDLTLDIDVQDPTLDNDQIGGTFGIPLDITFAGLSFASVRAFVRLYRAQVIGVYRGLHQLAAEIRYPDDFPLDPTIYVPKTPDPTAPYLLELNPVHQKCSQFEIRLASQFNDVPIPGDTFALELLACSVGVDPGKLHPLPSGRRFG
ncbi:MAG TPA: hypothetical protein VLZ78_02605 [Terrimesophilobacter sp.]|nr:hypothetical protein [Terrimesophilobacter sp.]